LINSEKLVALVLTVLNSEKPVELVLTVISSEKLVALMLTVINSEKLVALVLTVLNSENLLALVLTAAKRTQRYCHLPADSCDLYVKRLFTLLKQIGPFQKKPLCHDL
jgi:hypothetical protein